jgi:two-component system, OmpR family, sensor histidine kinase KdpD
MTRSVVSGVARWPGVATINPMERFGRLDWHGAPRIAALSVLSLVGSTAVVAVLERVVRVPNAALVYLLAVLIAGAFGGTWPAVATAVASTLLYDFFFVEPLYTLRISDASEWLDLLLFLAVGVAIGRLSGLQAQRAAEAADRARESLAMFTVSRSLATSDDLPSATRTVLAQLADQGGTERLWVGLGPTVAGERIVADTGSGVPPVATWQIVLQRPVGEEPARWARTHVARSGAGRSPDGVAVHRIRIEVPGETLGSLWVLRTPGAPDPDRAATRILSAAADQLGQAVRRERLVADGVQAEVARRSERLMSALLDSVSHDLRTPLATIRAAAGSLLDESVRWSPTERTGALRSIDLEAERMNRLVRNLLDLSRIEGGALQPDLEPHDLDDLMAGVLHRIQTDKEMRVDIPDDLPPLLVDDLYLDEILTNLLENAIPYSGSVIRIRACEAAETPTGPAVEIAIEDDGPGVPDADLDRLFDKFYRVHRPLEGSRPGMGIGLTVAQGLSRAMHGDITAGRSELGGLAFRVRLPAVRLPGEVDADPMTGSGVRSGAGE